MKDSFIQRLRHSAVRSALRHDSRGLAKFNNTARRCDTINGQGGKRRLAVPTVASSIAATEPVSGFGLAGFGTEQTHSRHLPSIHQIPVGADPVHKEFGSCFRW